MINRKSKNDNFIVLTLYYTLYLTVLLCIEFLGHIPVSRCDSRKTVMGALAHLPERCIIRITDETFNRRWSGLLRIYNYYISSYRIFVIIISLETVLFFDGYNFTAQWLRTDVTRVQVKHNNNARHDTGPERTRILRTRGGDDG